MWPNAGDSVDWHCCVSLSVYMHGSTTHAVELIKIKTFFQKLPQRQYGYTLYRSKVFFDVYEVFQLQFILFFFINMI